MTMAVHDNLRNLQVNRRLSHMKIAAEYSHLREGWIRYVRSALNITLAQLAKRVGVTTGAIAQAERNEIAGKTSLETLRKIAHAMECELVYGIVPSGDVKTVEEIIERVSTRKAKALLTSVEVHMALEDQAVSANLDERVNTLAHSLIEKGDVW